MAGQTVVLRYIDVAFEAVKLTEPFIDPASHILTDTTNDVESQISGRTYDLVTALRVVREMETSAVRAAVFDEIKRKNPIYRIVDQFYRNAGPRLFQPLMLFAYMLQCVMSVGPFGKRDAEAVSVSHFANEHKTIDRIAALAPDVSIMRLSLERGNMLGWRQAYAVFAMLYRLPKIWPFLRLLARSYSFMPAARMASALAFYMRFSTLFEQHSALKAALIASNYSPESVGLAAAAHRWQRRVVYANHAPVPANGVFVPPVLADCALFYGAEVSNIYKHRSACTAEVAFIGQPVQSRPMEWRDEVNSVGIFLTAGTRADVLKSLVASIRLDLPNARIIIRQHPVTLLKTDFSAIGVDDDKTELTLGNPLDTEIAACDLVICGNSGVSLNVLSGGRPVAYLSSLDDIAFDANGFVASRLVYSMPWWTSDLYERLRGFYAAPGWQDVMRRYDAAYCADIAGLHREAAVILMKHLRPQLPITGTSSIGPPPKLVA